VVFLRPADGQRSSRVRLEEHELIMATSNSTRETFDDPNTRHDEMHSTIETWLEDLVCEVDDAVSSASSSVAQRMSTARSRSIDGVCWLLSSVLESDISAERTAYASVIHSGSGGRGSSARYMCHFPAYILIKTILLNCIPYWGSNESVEIHSAGRSPT